MLKIGFTAVPHSKCVFQRGNIMILVYVDDVLIFSPTEIDTAKVKLEIGNAMPAKYLGPVDHFLGVDVHVHANSITLQQSNGIEALIMSVCM